MTKRKELMELLKDLPNDETWLDGVMERLKEKEPVIFNYMIASAKERLAELKEQEHMNTEDDEFNRIEREAVARKMSVSYNLEMQRLREEFTAGIPFVTQDELEQLLKDEE